MYVTDSSAAFAAERHTSPLLPTEFCDFRIIVVKLSLCDELAVANSTLVVNCQKVVCFSSAYWLS